MYMHMWVDYWDYAESDSPNRCAIHIIYIYIYVPIHLIDVLFRDGCWDYCYNYFEIGEEMAGAVTPFRVALGMFACFEIGERTRELYNYVFNSQVGRACNNFLLHQDIPSQYTYISYVFNCIV